MQGAFGPGAAIVRNSIWQGIMIEEHKNGAVDEAGHETAPGARDADDTAPDVEALLQEIEVLKSKADSNLDAAMRAQAELENVRRRVTRDVENAHKYALERFVQELLPVVDSMELGISAAASAAEQESVREGMELTLKKLRDTLQKFGVTPIDPCDEKFDPQRHEAVTMQDGAGAQPGTVLTVMQKGYELNGRLVRPAMVVVAK